MNDGVVAVDGQGRIALMTDRARELLGSYAGVSRRLADCGTHYLAVQAMLDRVMGRGEAVHRNPDPGGPDRADTGNLRRPGGGGRLRGSAGGDFRRDPAA